MSIHALSAEDCAAVMRWSSSDSLSFTFCAGSGVTKNRVVARELLRARSEGDRAGEGVGSPASGMAASRMVPRTKTRPELHLHPRHFIEFVRSARLDSLPGTRFPCAEDYTHPARAAQFEIFIAQIDFSDAEGDRSLETASWAARGRVRRNLSHGYDYFPARMPLLEIADRLGNLTEPVAPVDDRCDLCRLYELAQSGQVLLGYFRAHHDEFLADKARGHKHLEQTSENPDHPPAPAIRRSDHDVATFGIEDAPELGQRMVRHAVENHVITLSAPGEILSGVIHHLVGAERPHPIHIPRTAYSGHFGAKGLGDLHGKRTHASCRTINQNLLPLWDLALAAGGPEPKSLQCRQSRDRERRRLLKGHVSRLAGQLCFRSARVLGKGPSAAAENLVAGFKLRHVLANRLHLAG